MTKSRREDRQRQRQSHHVWLVLGLLIAVALSAPSIHIGFPITCVEALAAAKNRRKGRKPAGGGKGKGGFSGFGAPPQTLEDVLANIKTNRLPKDAPTLPCPCGSSKIFADCCSPLLENAESCQTPLQVLQSRYTAFCYRNIGHVIRTTHDECRDYRDDKVSWAKDLDKEGMFDSFEFVGLEILDEDGTAVTADSQDSGVTDNNEAFMEFRVSLKGRPLEEAPLRSRSLSSIEGEETVISERSRFLRNPESGEWKYAGGDVRSTVEGLEDTTLNA
mmetsp:Transcript_21736/g.44683  ORF Transcript_21736/g.44683 Transcript_21736/m.44683 type:complete len:275 (+) Transcript_21736:181-1005(+)|eukprot:CAMPEP_0197273300 /NCGR_PEP_ID=MMETSP1432-20130617/11088_1 /TAXON_ID=44447 /ORGANISM="Pseudo-nitzschia delicatissima, Strain UNC1205" /LENGTH=274 /DNA_ID=CAMNT_0042738951 /DNA_START=167 /DNA_END=991 /DNA_ORIENTATION=+